MILYNSLCQKKLEDSVSHFILLIWDILVTAFWSLFFSQSDGNERTGVQLRVWNSSFLARRKGHVKLAIVYGMLIHVQFQCE